MAAKGKPNQATDTNAKNCQHESTHDFPSPCSNSEISMVSAARISSTPPSLICLQDRRVNINLSGYTGCGKSAVCHPERSEGSAFLRQTQEKADSSGKPSPSE
jgi:hypothetical protein